VIVFLREIADEDRAAVLALRVAPGQVRAAASGHHRSVVVPGDGGPAGFYRRLGFAPTRDLDGNGEVIVRLALH